MVKRLAILGSTGSIGRSTLDVVARHPDRFEVVALAGGSDVELLAQQVSRFHPKLVSTRTEEGARELQQRLPRVDIGWGDDGVNAVAAYASSDLVVSAIVGSAGLVPTIRALESGKNIALANKETLVAAGELVMSLAKQKHLTILPIDSEHSAIHQSLVGHRREDVKRLIITASGGPFRTTPQDALERVTVDEALKHPNWSMGKKITIDSATMMNKGLEVIEAHWLFGIPADNNDVVVHPQSILHSLVEYCDGCTVAQLGLPDMRAPIAYALSYPERVTSGVGPLDLVALKSLTFESVDHQRFPALSLAMRALTTGRSMPAVLNAANETAVYAFLNRQISFLDIPRSVEAVMNEHDPHSLTSVEDVLDTDQWARAHAREHCS